MEADPVNDVMLTPVGHGLHSGVPVCPDVFLGGYWYMFCERVDYFGIATSIFCFNVAELRLVLLGNLDLALGHDEDVQCLGE